MSDGYEHEPIDDVADWELYAIREGLTDEELQQLLEDSE